MSLNPFATVSDYPSMLNKVAIFTFFAALIATGIFAWQVPAVKQLLPNMAVKVPETDIQVPLLVLLVALAFALISRMIKLHDRLSDLLGIRKRFDVYAILLPMASASGAALSLDQQGTVMKRRQQLMREVFYKYASSSPGKAQIEEHAITMALDQWSWYWICVEIMCILFLTSLSLFFSHRYAAASSILGLNFLIIWLLQTIREFCRRYAQEEIREILVDSARKRAVHEVFQAL
jgi:hypothetical protein